MCRVANMSFVALVVESQSQGAGRPKPAHIIILLLLILFILSIITSTHENHQSHQHHLNHRLSLPNQS